MQSTSAAPSDEPSRPQGVGLTALALSALVAIYLIRNLLYLVGGNLTATVVFEQLLMCCGRGIELFFVWHYWRGQDWARIFVLLWSFATAARELSVLIDRDDSLISLMSHPLTFFHALLACFLLYWLNTRPVRAWFKKISATAADLIAEHLVDKICTAVTNRGGFSSNVWRLTFEHDAVLTLACPWRIVLDDNLAFASNSGPDLPVDAEQPQQLLQNLRIKAVRVAPRTSDLFITFEMGLELQTWSTDPQSQEWKFSDPILTVVADSAGLNSNAIAASIPTEDAN